MRSLTIPFIIRTVNVEFGLSDAAIRIFAPLLAGNIPQD